VGPTGTVVVDVVVVVVDVVVGATVVDTTTVVATTSVVATPVVTTATVLDVGTTTGPSPPQATHSSASADTTAGRLTADTRDVHMVPVDHRTSDDEGRLPEPVPERP